MRLRHYSDAVLLAFQDGELPPWKRVMVDWHLQSCWECRSRTAMLEEQIQRLMNMRTQPSGPSNARLRLRVMAALDAAEREFASERPIRFSWLRIGAATAVTLFVIAFFGFLGSRHRSASELAALLEIARTEERAYASHPVHQSFRVVVARTRPQRSSRTATLDVWADPLPGRLAAHWRSDGTLKLALAKAAPRSLGRPIPLPAVFAAAIRVEHMEDAFLRWLESSPARLLSLGQNIAEFIREDGVGVRVERLSGFGGDRFRVIASRNGARLVTGVITDIDSRLRRVVLQTIRVETPEQAFEISFSPELLERPSREALAASFRFAEASATRQRPSPAPLSRRPRNIPPPPASLEYGEILRREIRVHELLHALNACTREVLETEAGSAGAVYIRGLVESPVRRAEIEAAFSGEPYVHLQTASPTSFGADIAAEVPSRKVVRSGPIPLDAEVRAHVGRIGSPGETASLAARFTSDAVSASETALVEAWAAQRLIAKFSPESWRSDGGATLRSMRDAHLANLRASIDRLRLHVEPVLSAASPDFDTGDETPSPDLLSAIRQVGVLTRGLFAGGSLTGMTANQAAARLLAELDRAAQLVRDAESSPFPGDIR